MIETTVVGSYPIKLSLDELIEAYEKREDVFLNPIKEAVGDQLFAGIDIVSSGQVRTDMISEFTKNLSGIVCRGGEHYIISKVKFVDPINLNDIKTVKSLIPNQKKIKTTITGAFTLAKSCTITEDSKYKKEEELALDFAKALNLEAKTLEPYVDIIQIDEPYFSQEFPKYAGKIISTLRKDIKKPIMLHVCGDVTEVFERLTDLEVDILDYEFAGNPSLLGKVAQVDFSQKIGYGCIQSHNPEIESVDKIARNIEKAIKVFGEENLLLDPDCGLRNLPREIAYQKLTNIVEARNKIFGIETTQAKRKSLGKEDWDPRGYFYIFIDPQRKKIRAEHYRYDHVLHKIVEGKRAEPILHTILNLNLTSNDVNGKRHYGYVATELQKAEIALRNNLDYIQDRIINFS